MSGTCQYCGAQLAVGAVACFRCGRMVERAEQPGTGASVVLAPTHIGTVAKAELLEGQWRLVTLLGQGGVGQVWQAHDVTLDRSVAVKLMHASIAEDPSLVARFEREARVLAGLEHPNLLPVLGIGRLGARPFLVTRLLEGRTLAELMHQRGGKLPPEEAAVLLAPICDALACLHEAQVIHRDLKPSNVFVGDDKRVTLMDLGSAQEAGSELTRFGEVLGTAGYLSPEQKLGKGILDGKSDVYALGCLLLEIVTGKIGSVETASDVPPVIASLVQQAMAFEPKDRPTPQQFKARLAPFLGGQGPIPQEAITPIVGRDAFPRPSASPEITPIVGRSGHAPIEAPSGPGGVTPLVARARPSAPVRHDEKITAPEQRTRRLVKTFRPSLSRRAIGVMSACAVLILGAFLYAIAQPPAKVPAPVRVDHPQVEVVIEKPEVKIVAMTELPKIALPVPNLLKKKEAANTDHGFIVARVTKKSDRARLPPGLVRLITTANGRFTSCQMWIKRSPGQKEWELLGHTPVQFIVNKGEVNIRLQERPDDPFLQFPYRVPAKRPWFKSLGRIRVEIGAPTTEDEPVSRAEPVPEEEPEPQPEPPPEELPPADDSVTPR